MINLAIQIPFDNTGNPIRPTFVLATKGCRKLGAIPASNIHIADKFNSYFDLGFRVYKYNNCVKCNLWDEIKDFRFVWCPEWDVWFEIYVEINESNDMVKNVSAKSVGEAELSQINLYDIHINTEEDISQEDYVPTVLYDASNPKGSLLDRMTEKAPHYKTYDTYVDDSIQKIQRTFNFDNKSIYDSFQEVGEEIDCLFEIDSGTNSAGKVKREYRVHDLESHCNVCGYRGDDTENGCPKCGADIRNIVSGYGEDTTIFISEDNLADDITYKTNVDSVKNCFKLKAGDDLMTATVVNCNPNGSSYIWYIPEEAKRDMSPELRNALNAYEERFKAYQESDISLGSVSSYNNTVSYCNNLKSVDNFEFETLPTLSTPVAGYSNLMTAYYNTVDLKLLLESGLMPSPIIPEEDKEKSEVELQADKVIGAIEDLLKLSIAIMGTIAKSLPLITNAILSFLKTFLGSKFDISALEVSADDESDCKLWSGILKIFNRSDESQCAFLSFGRNTGSEYYSNASPFSVSDAKGTYNYQKVIKTLNSNNDATDIVSIFGLTNTAFKDELKKYSLKRLESFRDACQACLDVLTEAGTSDADVLKLYNEYYTKLNAIKAEIITRESQIRTVENMQNIIVSKRDSIQKDLQFESFIKGNGEALWAEFAAYRRDDCYSNENYISDGLNNSELFEKAQEFYDVAQNEIFKSATLQHSITATLKNLLVMKEFRPIIKYFKVGNWIRLRVDDKVYKLRLLSYEINFDNLDNIQVEFSDVQKIKNGVSDVKSILDQAASIATSYNTVSRQASQGQKGNARLNTWVSDGLALTQMKIINSAKNQNVIWDEGGILCREYNDITEQYEKEQLKIINTTLAITDDDWASVKTAIGKFYYIHPSTNKETLAFGVNAETVVGKLLIGQELGIYNADSTMTFDENGLKVSKSTNPNLYVSINPNSSSIFTIKNGTKDIFYIDTSGNGVFSGKLSAAGGTFEGTLSGANGDFEGKITANDGYIGGWDISSAILTSDNNKVGMYSGTNYEYQPKLSSSVGYVRFFAGGNLSSSTLGTQNQNSCPFLVDSLGRLKATNAYIEGEVYATKGKFEGEIEVGSNFSVDSDGIMTATGAILKGSDDATFKFSKKTNTWVPWGDNSSGNNLPVAILSDASYIVNRNIVTGVEVSSSGSMTATPYNDGTAAGFVHCRTTSSGNVYKARFGLDNNGNAFIQITEFDESKPKVTFYFKQNGTTDVSSG